MKTFSIVALLCCSMLFHVASAQEPSAEQQVEAHLRFLLSPAMQLGLESSQLANSRSPWNGHGSWMPLRHMLLAGAEGELGLTEDQKQRLAPLYAEPALGWSWYLQMLQNPTPEFVQIQTALEATRIPDDPYFEHATEEQKNAYREASFALENALLAVMQTEIQETLTPEQMLQVRKLEMQMMSEMGIPFPSMFDPLDLTEEQREEMNNIADELKAEFDQLTMESAVLHAERHAAMYRSLHGQSFASQTELHTVLQERQRRFVPSEEMRRRGNDLQERGTRLMTLLQTRLMNVLTDDQLDKMQEILNATPEFANNLIAERRARREAARQSPIYMPGPDSWRPGDPMPTQFREERQRSRFPRSE